MSDARRLIEYAEKGEWDVLSARALFGTSPQPYFTAYSAFNGSTDAAQKLIALLMPDRAWSVSCGGEYGSVAEVSDAVIGSTHRGKGAIPSRALFVATLNALLAEDDRRLLGSLMKVSAAEYKARVSSKSSANAMELSKNVGTHENHVGTHEK